VTPRGTHQIGRMAPCFLNPSLTLNYLQTGAKLDLAFGAFVRVNWETDIRKHSCYVTVGFLCLAEFLSCNVYN